MEETDVGGGFGDDLAVEFEDESQNTVSGGMGRPHVDDHLFPDVVARLLSMLIANRRIGCDYARRRIRIFNFARGKSHSVGLGLCSRVVSPVQGEKRSSTCA